MGLLSFEIQLIDNTHGADFPPMVIEKRDQDNKVERIKKIRN